MLSLVVEEKISSGDIHARISKISRIVEMGRTQWRYTELNGRGNTNFCQQLDFITSGAGIYGPKPRPRKFWKLRTGPELTKFLKFSFWICQIWSHDKIHLRFNCKYDLFENDLRITSRDSRDFWQCSHFTLTHIINPIGVMTT